MYFKAKECKIRQTEHPKHSWKGWPAQVIFLSFGTSSVFWGGTDPKEQINISPFSQWSSWDGLDSAHRPLLLSAGIKHLPKCKITQIILFLTEEIVKIQFKWHWKLLMLNNSISSGSNLLRCFWPWVEKDIVSNKVSLIFLHSVLYSQTLKSVIYIVVNKYIYSRIPKSFFKKNLICKSTFLQVYLKLSKVWTKREMPGYSK